MKKKTRLVSLLLVCILLVGMLCSFASAVELRYYTYGTVTVEGANLRSAPELDPNNVLGILEKGVRVRIIRELPGDGITWYEVYVASGENVTRTGFVSTGNIVLD